MKTLQLKFSAYFTPHSWGLLVYLGSVPISHSQTSESTILVKICLLIGHVQSLDPPIFTLPCIHQPLHQQAPMIYSVLSDASEPAEGMHLNPWYPLSGLEVILMLHVNFLLPHEVTVSSTSPTLFPPGNV